MLSGLVHVICSKLRRSLREMCSGSSAIVSMRVHVVLVRFVAPPPIVIEPNWRVAPMVNLHYF